jgi:hypothetical protein
MSIQASAAGSARARKPLRSFCLEATQAGDPRDEKARSQFDAWRFRPSHSRDKEAHEKTITSAFLLREDGQPCDEPPLQFTTSTGAVLYLPNLYADIKGIPWLFGGTAWAGTRYYKRESVYISDFFYWNPSGVGAGIEDVNLGPDLRLSYGAFAVDGEPAMPADATSPQLPSQTDFGIRNDLQLRGIRPYQSGELQLGFQYIANYSNDPATSGGWGVTVQFVQGLLGGDNSWRSSMARAAERALDPWRAFIIPTSPFATTRTSLGCGSWRF